MEKSPKTTIIETIQSDAVGGGFLDKHEMTPQSDIHTNNTNLVFTPDNDIMEFLPVVNERGIIVGRALYMELHNGNKILHPVIHLHVINNKGEVVRRF